MVGTLHIVDVCLYELKHRKCSVHVPIHIVEVGIRAWMESTSDLYDLSHNNSNTCWFGCSRTVGGQLRRVTKYNVRYATVDTYRWC